MNPINSKAAYWLQQGLFDDLKSFADFESRVNVVFEEKDRGDLFEIFIEGYIATQAITQRVKHWVVGNIPLEMRERYNLPSDGTGIDGIYETHDGSHVAYQVKYRQNHNLTFAEVAPFLGITEKFLDRVIFTNATALSHKAVVRTRWYSGDAFNSLSEDQLKQIESWLKEKPVPVVRATPNPSYQTQALADIDSTFQKHARATVVMACGTGKTLVALWAAEQAKPKTVLVLLPSLTLLQQTLKEWSEQTSWGSRFSYLCVCSDKTVGLKNDEINIDKTEVGFRVDTDPAIVRQFLEHQSDDVKVIFSTYHSTDVVAEGSLGLPPFDLAIFDEAHKTTGLSGGTFSHALSDEKVRINKRLFLTATPRHIDIRKRDKEGEFRVQSMDDETVYGPRAHTLSFGEAANKGIICRYKVIISLIDKQMVDDFTRNNGITLVDGDEIGARWVANLIALDQAVKKVDAKKIITFHSRVALAQEFATNEPRGIAYYLKGYDVRHVNGSQNSGERSQLITAFANSAKSVITNARCLTEGVNIPAVDMVAFIDPRQSKVDITQAVGRAMRKPRGATTKTVGYVLVPLFAGVDNEGLEEAIKTEKFDAIADILNALQEHDEELVDIIRELQERKGRGEVFDPKRLLEKVEVIGPMVGLDELTRSISVAITDSLGVTWDEWFGRLEKFKDREGHCRVPTSHREEGYRLGQWVGTQRVKKEKLSEFHTRQLNELGFIWNSLNVQWEEGYLALKKFKEREGHCVVPQKYLYEKFRLGQWVNVQRTIKSELSEERLYQLNKLDFIWSVLEEKWEVGFGALLKFKIREGHCRVARIHMEDGYELGGWVKNVRKRKLELSDNHLRRLNELGFSWDVLTEQWEAGFGSLLKYKAREGHCLVPTDYLEDGFRLGKWISSQRTHKSELSEERIHRLNKLDFSWNVIEDKWEVGFSALLKFNTRERHCRVSRFHIEDGYRLGMWISGQRTHKAELSVERIHRLNELGFSWDVLTEQWEAGFGSLLKYKAREGHCLVPTDYLEGGFRLGQWVSVQRTTKSKLSEERCRRLNEIGFAWNKFDDQWEAGFNALLKYKAREGHCLVPTDYLEGGFRLGQWVGKQRSLKNKLLEDRCRRLNEIGFAWNKFDDQWEEGFDSLVKYKAHEGHCRVPTTYLDNGYRLGAWVSGLRSKEEKLSEDRRRRLKEIGFVWDVKNV